jgi:GntR family transcriptional regulator / MocR family aminotransferase
VPECLDIMRDAIFHISKSEPLPLQHQIQAKMVDAILSGSLPAGSPVPSTRLLAKRLKVSRNTVTLAYQSLAVDGYLEPRERAGFFVSGNVRQFAPLKPQSAPKKTNEALSQRLAIRPSLQSNISKPSNWHDFPFPFIYGQSDPGLFPMHEWRDCTRQAVSRKLVESWTDDSINQDDAQFVDQIRQRILPRRGINASPSEILVTMGAQNALYILASLLCGAGNRIGLEDPCYPDARNIFSLHAGSVATLPIDGEGIVLGKALKSCDVVYLTPSHQMPTNVTMSQDRRRDLLHWARGHGALIIEDDYEFEANYLGEATPALKSIDQADSVVYVGSLSKSIVPGLRIGFLVGPRELIEEARALRRLMLRHPPGNNQRVTALFLALGHHDTLIGRLQRTYRERWTLLSKAVQDEFPGWAQTARFGGTAFWMRGPDWLDASELASRAAEYGVLIEPGQVFFADPAKGANHFRLGFSSIATERIGPGISILARATREIAKGRALQP